MVYKDKGFLFGEVIEENRERTTTTTTTIERTCHPHVIHGPETGSF